MLVVGLTGSIGMGKSTVGRMFADAGVPVCSSDDVVHALYAPGGAGVEVVARLFPETMRDGGVDRAALGKIVLNDSDKMAELEAVVHPLVRATQMRFIEEHRQSGADVVVLDIPLLLEGGGARVVDKVIVVSAPTDVQRARVLARPGMSEQKLSQILARQMPDAEKRKRADFVIDTGVSLDETRAQVGRVLDRLRELA